MEGEGGREGEEGWKTERLWLLAIMWHWHDRGKCCGSWPPFFPHSTETCFLRAGVVFGFIFGRANDGFLEDLQNELFLLRSSNW